MGGIFSKLFGRGYKLNDPGLSTDDTTIKEKQGHSKEGGKPAKQQGKAPPPRPPRPSSKVEDVPKQEEKEHASQPTPGQIAATVAVELIEKAISGEKAPTPEKDAVKSEKPTETKPEPVSEPPPAYQPVVDVLKSSAETVAREASEAIQKVLTSEKPVVEPPKPTEEEKLPEPPPAPYQPVVDVLRTSGEVAASVAGEIFEKVANLADDKPKEAEEQKKLEPVQEAKPAEPEQRPFIDVVRDTASEFTSNVVSGVTGSFSTEKSEAPSQAPKEPPKEAPPPPPEYEPDQEPQQPLLDVLKSTATVAASGFFDKLASNEEGPQNQEEKKDVEEKPKEHDDAPIVDVLKSSTRAAVSFASGLLDDTPPTDEPKTDSQLEKEASVVKQETNDSEHPGVRQRVVEMARAEAEAVAAKIVEEVKAIAEERVQQIMAGKENAEDSSRHLSVPDAEKRHHDDDRDRSPTPNEIESAVVKIQAGVRGYLTRKMLHEKSPQHHDDEASHNGSHEHPSAPKTTVSDSSNLVKENHNSRLQGSQEGNAEEQHGSFISRMSERVVDELSHLDPHYTEMAATKIQAAFRGYRVRKEMKPDNGPHALHKSEVSH
ncbi:fibrous sheath CABYR-binding protein-like isoform X1 [Ornithodoros turicata]|uniref:fibrous sheath CABYR-binding protein-like isoform X1 n=1 Tax=Ornithodoros turicata TaxID=34597 RepID=UPI0031389AB9